MNKESEALQSLFAWLLQDPPTNASCRDGEPSSPGTDASGDGVDDLELADIDPLDSEEGSPALSSNCASEAFPPTPGGQQLKMGEIPAVQDRFYALLKRRVQIEIQRKPPLFPWESDVSEYSDCQLEEKVPEPLWTPQFLSLNLPVAVPEPVLVQLLERCQNLVQSSLRQGAKLVRAVEALFPGQPQTLNEVTGLVLRWAEAQRGRPEPRNLASLLAQTDLPSSYEAATPRQQMVLSLLAAQDIIGSLTVDVSPAGPRKYRQWLTAAGMLDLEAEYHSGVEFPRLRVQCHLPCGGSLEMRCGETRAMSQRPDEGCLSVEVFDPQPDQTYSLEVWFHNQDQKPLVFAICPKP
ncbi:hypothetical protein [Kamptonema formosum]|uniref:hypothetical protein n=1 Tax=Kamptonema formosum TaxID=331992 RepID=UPI00035C7E67|nr:hypothetical protein [Oscillatoria sp. PCC 10802]